MGKNYFLTNSPLVTEGKQKQFGRQRAVVQWLLQEPQDIKFVLAPCYNRYNRPDDFVFVEANEAAGAMMGRNLENLIGQKLIELLNINPFHSFFQNYLRTFLYHTILEQNIEFPLLTRKNKRIVHRAEVINDMLLVIVKVVRTEVTKGIIEETVLQTGKTPATEIETEMRENINLADPMSYKESKARQKVEPLAKVVPNAAPEADILAEAITEAKPDFFLEAIAESVPASKPDEVPKVEPLAKITPATQPEADILAEAITDAKSDVFLEAIAESVPAPKPDEVPKAKSLAKITPATQPEADILAEAITEAKSDVFLEAIAESVPASKPDEVPKVEPLQETQEEVLATDVLAKVKVDAEEKLTLGITETEAKIPEKVEDEPELTQEKLTLAMTEAEAKEGILVKPKAETEEKLTLIANEVEPKYEPAQETTTLPDVKIEEEISEEPVDLKVTPTPVKVVQIESLVNSKVSQQVSTEGKIEYINQQVCDILELQDYTRQAVFMQDVLHKVSQLPYKLAMLKAKARQSVEDLPLIFVTRNNVYVKVIALIIPQLNGEEITGMHHFFKVVKSTTNFHEVSAFGQVPSFNAF